MKKALILVFGIFILTACDKKPETVSEEKEVEMVGAWSEVPVENDVKEALDFVIGEIGEGSSLAEVKEAKKQVVKGFNYKFKLSLDNGQIWNVIVYRDLDGTFTVVNKEMEEK